MNVFLAGIVILMTASVIFADGSAVASADEYPQYGVVVETVADNLDVPWSIDWLPDGTALFTERGGDLRVVKNGVLQEESLLSLKVSGTEGGLLGIAVDPDFAENGFIYLYYTYDKENLTLNKVVRYHLDGITATESMVLIDGIPGGEYHDGGRIQFGPDGKIYITTGDAGKADLAQNPESVAGKILRINSDGTIPNDNPWDNSPVYSIGHRNPQGIDWDESGNLLATEHGPSGLLRYAHDEINLIVPGANYGWPDIIGDQRREGLQSPIFHTGDDTWAPSGSEFYSGSAIPQWTGKYFVATLRGTHLHMLDFDGRNGVVTSHEKMFNGEFGRLRDVQTGPDGLLYILTSNQDGRGNPMSGDDRILRIVPLEWQTENKGMQDSGSSVTSQNVECLSVSESNTIHVGVKVQWNKNMADTIRVTGCVTDKIPYPDTVNIDIADPDGMLVASGTAVPKEDGTFEWILDNRTVTTVNGTYSVTASSEDGRFVATNTFVVPEFGAVLAVAVMLAAMAAAVLLTAKFLPTIRLGR